ncbi:MAG: P-II family nitrogen regulator [Hespellia sp.]|nr:P-II family nitrogen regulator [Hespellia sp.]
MDIIMDTARTGENGNSGDGRVFVVPIEEAYTISSQSKDN